jgi:hypothetical protein
MISTYTFAVGLLILSVFSNFSAKLLNFHLQHELMTNPIAKHITVFMLLLFLIVLTMKDEFVQEHKGSDWLYPELLKTAVSVYLIFILLIKSTFEIMILALLLITVIMVLHIEIENRPSAENLKTIVERLSVATIGLLVVGVVLNHTKQARYYGKAFTEYRFWIGTLKQ